MNVLIIVVLSSCLSYPCGTVFECAHYDKFTALVVSSSDRPVEGTVDMVERYARVRFVVIVEYSLR